MGFLDSFFSRIWIWRWLRGGHWEQWSLEKPFNRLIVWERVPKGECFRLTGKRPCVMYRGSPYCEEKGRDAYNGATYCECGRDLTRAPGVHGSYDGDPDTSTVFTYSCPCGRWPRFHYGPPAPIYLGDAKERTTNV
jgi:hypothetical protein